MIYNLNTSKTDSITDWWIFFLLLIFEIIMFPNMLGVCVILKIDWPSNQQMTHHDTNRLVYIFMDQSSIMLPLFVLPTIMRIIRCFEWYGSLLIFTVLLFLILNEYLLECHFPTIRRMHFTLMRISLNCCYS